MRLTFRPIYLYLLILEPCVVTLEKKIKSKIVYTEAQNMKDGSRKSFLETIVLE